MGEMRSNHAEAMTKLNQVDEYMHQARQGLQKMQNSATTMTASSWLGNQANVFAQKMQQHHDDMHAVVNQVTQHIETAKNAVNTFHSHDAEA
jgi:uncharacterized protein YukE